MAHDGTSSSSDVFEWLLTMLAPEVSLDLIAVAPMGEHATVPEDVLQKDQNRAEQLGRAVTLLPEKQPNGPDLVQLAREGDYNVIVLPWSEESRAFSETPPGEWVEVGTAQFALQRIPGFAPSYSARSGQRIVNWATADSFSPIDPATSLTVGPRVRETAA